MSDFIPSPKDSGADAPEADSVPAETGQNGAVTARGDARARARPLTLREDIRRRRMVKGEPTRFADENKRRNTGLQLESERLIAAGLHDKLLIVLDRGLDAFKVVYNPATHEMLEYPDFATQRLFAEQIQHYTAGVPPKRTEILAAMVDAHSADKQDGMAEMKPTPALLAQLELMAAKVRGKLAEKDGSTLPAG